MKPIKILTILFSLLFICGSTHSQTANASRAWVKTMHPECLLDTLKSLTESERQVLISIDTIRYEVIKKLDTLISNRYEAWNNKNTYTKYYNSTNCVPEPDIFMNDLIKTDTSLITNAKSLIDGSDKVNKTKYKRYKDNFFFTDWNILFEFLQLYDVDVAECCEEIIRSNLSFMNNPTSNQYLNLAFQASIRANQKYSVMGKLVNKNQYIPRYFPPTLARRNLTLIQNNTSYVESKNYVFYHSYDVGKEKVMGIEFGMDNDLFFFLWGGNQDREFTGGGGVNVATNMFAANWLNPEWFIQYRKSDKSLIKNFALHYQSIGLNMTFNTPYIRYRDNITLADTLYKFDRPFSSYVYIDRTKYRLWKSGLIRQNNSFQVGIIGSNLGRDIQAMIHRDVTIQSQKVYGWHRQIANGGRWLIQTRMNFDAIFLSTTNNYKSIFAPKVYSENDRAWGFNWIGSTKVMWGGYLSGIELGSRISTTDFTKQSGKYALLPFKKNSKYGFAFSAEIGYRYQRIFHNSLLEGFGYMRTFKDDRFDDEAISEYTLNADYYLNYDNNRNSDETGYIWITKDKTLGFTDEMRRNVHFFDLKINLRWNRISAYMDMTMHTKEYQIDQPDFEQFESLLNPELVGDELEENIWFFRDKVIPELNEFNNRKVYAFGRVGLVWILK